MFWSQANDYCHWLGNILKQPITLPTEAQWEYAARSRGFNVGYATNWGTINPKKNINILTREESRDLNLADAYPPNPLGFYGMSGNLAEWVNDWYASDYYEKSAVNNPRGPESGTQRIARGGSIYQNINWRITTLRTDVAKLPPSPSDNRKNTHAVRDTPAYVNSFYTGARCVVHQKTPPSESGFGVMAGEIPENFPKRLSWVPLHGNNINYNKNLGAKVKPINQQKTTAVK
jgi:formylglycine-generating enzyme required for sulfatase activity